MQIERHGWGWLQDLHQDFTSSYLPDSGYLQDTSIYNNLHCSRTTDQHSISHITRIIDNRTVKRSRGMLMIFNKTDSQIIH